MMRRGELLPHAFQAPVDVHASADGQVYMFRKRQDETAGSSEDEELNVMELRPRVRQDQGRLGNFQLLEREVLDGDNLNKLALHYGCKVADIKRVNNLIHEQDLFALKSIKIPVQKHSFLTETYTSLSDAVQEMPNPTPSKSSQLQDRDRVKPQLKEVTDFLKEVDNDIEKLIQTTSAHNDDSSEMPLRFDVRGKRLTSYGADWGIQWWNAVVAMLLIGIILPLFYVVYFKTKDSEIVSALNSSNEIDSSMNSSNHSGIGPRSFQSPG